MIPAIEFEQRARRVAELGAEWGLDAVLAWARCGGTVDRYANVLYLANYYNPWPNVVDFPPMWSGQGNAGVLVTREGERVLVTNVAEAEWRAHEVRCDSFVDDPHIHCGVARALSDRGLQRARIGLAAAESMSVGLHRLLLDATPEVRWQPADELLLRARRIKSPGEMALIREAVAAGDEMMEAMLVSVVPGNREGDVHRAGWTAALEHGALPYDTPGSSGPLAGVFAPSALPSWSERRLEDGDLWHTDMYGVKGGYLFDFSRSTVAGTPSPAQVEVMEACVSVVEQIIDAIRPGATFSEVHAVGLAAAAGLPRHLAGKPGEDDSHAYPHFGHTIGLGWEDLWVWAGEHTAFQPGMHVAVETSVGHPDVGFAMFEQNLLVVEGGIELTSLCTPRPWR